MVPEVNRVVLGYNRRMTNIEDRSQSPDHWNGLFRRSIENGQPMYGEGFRTEGEQLIEHLTDRDILDLGAGDGRLALAMAANGNRVMALDFSEAAVSQISTQADQLDAGEVDARVVDLSDAMQVAKATEGRKFDVVTLVNVIQFMDRERIEELWSVVAEQLEPNGEVLIRGPQPKPPLFHTPEHENRGAYSQFELASALDRAGLALVNYKQFDWPPTKSRTGSQPAYWAFAQHHPLSIKRPDNRVRLDGEF